MSTKTIGWILTVFPIVGMITWFVSGLPQDPPGDMAGGYGAYATELAALNSDSIHVFMGIATLVFAIVTTGFIGLRAKVLDSGSSTLAYMSGMLIIVGFAGTVVENGTFSAAASLAGEGLIQESVSMLTLGTTAGGFGTAILALGLGFLGYSLCLSKILHVITQYSFMLVSVLGVLGGILFYDSGLIIAYYASFTFTSVAAGIELVRTGK
tara:strand:+ start:6775 stop:7404 length:630 start_codon:yes stop_codon:yes gene_type:complete